MYKQLFFYFSNRNYDSNTVGKCSTTNFQSKKNDETILPKMPLSFDYIQRLINVHLTSMP